MARPYRLRRRVRCVPRRSNRSRPSRRSPALSLRCAVDHRQAAQRNPDASRSRRAPDAGIGDCVRHDRSALGGSTGTGQRRHVAVRAGPGPHTLTGSRLGRGRSVGTPPPVRGSGRRGTSDLYRASTLSANTESAMDAGRDGCNTARRTRAHLGTLARERGDGTNCQVSPVVALCFTSARGLLNRRPPSRASRSRPRDRASCPPYRTPSHDPASGTPRHLEHVHVFKMATPASRPSKPLANGDPCVRGKYPRLLTVTHSTQRSVA